MVAKSIRIIAFMGAFGAGVCAEGGLFNQGDRKMSIDYKGKPDSFWKQNLKLEVYAICRQKGTEAAGSGAYDHFYEKGTYYCACCGGDHAVYSSGAKYDSGTGWPSFWEPITPGSVALKEDRDGLFGWAHPRTEVVCSRCGGHLGHVFDDGPKEHTGQRYCMNSRALIFVAEGQTPKNSFGAETSQEASKS
jgi:peptide-methionine (R)-S-oxide reductase